MKTLKQSFIVLAIVTLIFIASSCDSLSDDCDEYNQTVERYDELIEWARDNGDSVQVHLLIDERNRKLSDLDC